MLSLCATNSFSNKFDCINKESKCDCLFIYIKLMLSLCLANIVAAKTIVMFTTKKAKD